MSIATANVYLLLVLFSFSAGIVLSLKNAAFAAKVSQFFGRLSVSVPQFFVFLAGLALGIWVPSIPGEVVGVILFVGTGDVAFSFGSMLAEWVRKKWEATPV